MQQKFLLNYKPHLFIMSLVLFKLFKFFLKSNKTLFILESVIEELQNFENIADEL